MNQAPWSTGIGLVFVSNQTNKNLLLRSIGPSPLGGLSGLDLYKGKIDHIHGNFKRLDQNKKKKKNQRSGFSQLVLQYGGEQVASSCRA